LTSSQRVCRPATRSKSKSKLNPIGHQPPPPTFFLSLFRCALVSDLNFMKSACVQDMGGNR
jgi:hypothetical protein